MDFIQLLECVGSRISSIFGSFRPLFLQYFLPLFLSSPSGIPIICLLACFMVSCRSLRHSSSFCLLFSFCSSDCIVLTDLSPSLPFLSSVCLNLILNPSSQFFISVVLSCSRISIWFLSMISVSLLIILYLLRTSFSWFPLALCSCIPLILCA